MQPELHDSSALLPASHRCLSASGSPPLLRRAMRCPSAVNRIALTEFVINGTYYVTSEYYLRPSTYVCVAPIAASESLLFGAMNKGFIPRDNYGYIKCVTGNGPTWLNVTLGPGAYALVAAIYGPNSSSTITGIAILRPVTGTLLNSLVSLVYYPQCGYPSLGEVPLYCGGKAAIFPIITPASGFGYGRTVNYLFKVKSESMKGGSGADFLLALQGEGFLTPLENHSWLNHSPPGDRQS